MVAGVVEDKMHADVYVVESFPADASPDKLRARLEDGLDTLSYNFRKHPTLPADAATYLEQLARADDEDMHMKDIQQLRLLVKKPLLSRSITKALRLRSDEVHL